MLSVYGGNERSSSCSGSNSNCKNLGDVYGIGLGATKGTLQTTLMTSSEDVEEDGDKFHELEAVIGESSDGVVGSVKAAPRAIIN